jgi:hypothetical protein
MATPDTDTRHCPCCGQPLVNTAPARRPGARDPLSAPVMRQAMLAFRASASDGDNPAQAVEEAIRAVVPALFAEWSRAVAESGWVRGVTGRYAVDATAAMIAKGRRLGWRDDVVARRSLYAAVNAVTGARRPSPEI